MPSPETGREAGGPETAEEHGQTQQQAVHLSERPCLSQGPQEAVTWAIGATGGGLGMDVNHGYGPCCPCEPVIPPQPWSGAA